MPSRLFLAAVAAVVASVSVGGAQEDALAKFQADAAILGLADDLGTVIGSEAFCGLAFDQDAIAAWIAERVPAERMDFPSKLQLSIIGQSGFNAEMSESAKTAHCAAVARIAKAYRFTP